MTQYNYTGKSITDAQVLIDALKDEGADMDLTILVCHDYGSGDGCVETDLDQSTFDKALDKSIDGELFSNKFYKLQEIQNNSAELLTKGVETWSSGEYAELNKQLTDEYITDYQFYSDNPSELSASLPYMVGVIGNGFIPTTDINDIKTLYENAVHRMQYIYVAASNSDGSKSELGYAVEINGALTQSDLDSIVDTRV